jgi:hypothetical protein
MRTSDAPSHNRYSHFRCEHGIITKVNPKTWTVVVETTHSSKTVDDVNISQPYLHFAGGEGIHHMPEVGAEVFLAWPSDNTNPFVMGYVGVASTLQSPDGAPLRSDGDEGSATDVTYRSGRPELDPGDIAITGRDRNFVIFKRGGVVQIGSTHLAQRFYLPTLNYIKDFAENYSLNTLGGSVSWEVERAESDPSGEAPASWTLYANAYAQDAKASVRVRHTALSSPSGGERVAWDVVVAPQGIDNTDGSVSGEVYQLSVLMDGTKTELIGASRSVTVKGNDRLTVEGDQAVRVNGDLLYRIDGKATLRAGGELVLQGQRVRHGSGTASEPAVLGQQLFNLLSTAKWPVAPVGGSLVASPPPDFIINLRRALSRKVFVE